MTNKYYSKLSMRKEWIQFLTEDLVNVPRQGEALKIGFVGALGSGDVGDEAMLIALSDEIRVRIPNVEIICFSVNPGLTYSYTGIISKPQLIGVLSPYRNLFYALALVLNRVEVALTNRLSRIFKTKKTYQGEWMFRLFYLSFTKLILLTLSLRSKKSKKGKVNRHIQDILSLDAIIYLGGAYLNSWNVKSAMYNYLFPATIAINSNIPVFASGLNLGPYNMFDFFIVRDIIKHFKLIGLRDYRESVNILRKMKIYDERKHIDSCDDAINLLPNPALDISQFVDEISPYIALNLHYWNLSTERWADFSLKVANILRDVVARHELNIVPVSMAFSDSSELLDYSAMKKIISMSGVPASRYKLPPKPISIGSIKTLFEKAALTVGTRHHAMVLSVSSETPTIAIAYDDYYKMKHEGVGRHFKENFHVFDVHKLDINELIELINVIITARACIKEG